ncbi:MAG: ornithine--oxo-acid transaminase [Candidatus Aenigmarchaeota archaeon]|nr:ornithine--oxo-acid transaminase [Candidatus Aenigmarchaeota archaeon]
MDEITKGFIEKADKYGVRNYSPLPVVLKSGKGIYVYDVSGKKYFDMLSAYSAVNQGHCHIKIGKAAIEQIKKLTLTSRAFHNDKMGLLLEKISKLTGMPKVLLMNSGAEGVETSIKAMRKWGYDIKGVEKDKAEIIIAEGNFHGRTTTIVGLSSDNTAKNGFGPFTPGFVSIPYNDIKSLENTITKNTVGFLVEPVQGEAGILIPDRNYLKEVRRICSEKNVLLCLDEVQTGLGRTGKLFCFEHSEIRPDMIVMGKALSGGFYPISAVAASEEIMNVFTPGTHGSTFGGSSLASAIGVAALDVIVDEKLPERSAELGKYFLEKLKQIDNQDIKEIRGIGLFVAIEMKKPIAKEICKKLMDVGVLAKDTHETTIRFAPPLVIKKEEIDDAVELIHKVI